MHVVLGWRTWLWMALGICAAATAVAYKLDPQPLAAAQRGISVGSIVSALAVATPVWRLLWLVPSISEKLPLLDGRWVGVQKSNWPLISALAEGSRSAGYGVDVDKDPLPPLLETEVVVEVTSSFFTIGMKLVSVSKYQNSELRAAILTPATLQARGRLTYMFASRVPIPERTDSGRFDGAADLEIHKDDDGTLRLEGPVWTNRNWAKGLNTAGCIQLTRREDWSAPKWLRERSLPTR